MGDAAGEETKTLRITGTDGDGASTQASMPPLEEERRRRPVPPPAAAGVAATAAGGYSAEQRCREEEEEADDEQVERFYTLLANIRALRGLYSAGDGTATDGRGRKRAREAEAPWRPAFRMEDFEEEVSQVAGDARCAVTKQGASGAAGVREGEQVGEARGRKLGRRVAARG